MAKYGMVIDLERCVACGSCMLACKAEHHVPPGIFWNRILTKEHGKYPRVTRSSVPVLCNHCHEAACVKVCPAGATTQRADGVVLLDYEKCIGCRYCMMACPYGARYFYPRVTPYYPGAGLTPREVLGHRELQTGVVMKCNFCQERLDAGVNIGLRPGIDREATPVCVNTCIASARYFGDLDDPDSEISHLIRSKRGYQLHPEFGTEPSVYYLE